MKKLKNEIQEDRMDDITRSLTVMSGKALFQVTLIPDKNDKQVLSNHDAAMTRNQLIEFLNMLGNSISHEEQVHVEDTPTLPANRFDDASEV
jgi:hypothetical protein